MLLKYNFPHVFYPGSDKRENSLVLKAQIDFLIRVNTIYLLESKRLGRSVPPLYRSGVTYERTTWWEPIPALYERRWGDCKSLASALVAQYRLQGIACEPTFRWVENADKTLDFHILVFLGDYFEDPSKVLGMGQDENAKFFSQLSYT